MIIVLIGCTKQKAKITCKAIDMYKASPYYRRRLEYATKVLKADKIYILSAEHHLLDPKKEIAPYDTTLKDFSKAEKIKWAETVFEQIKNNNDFKGATIYILAGKDYSLDLEGMLVKPEYNLINPFKDMEGIGDQMHWLIDEIKKVHVISIKTLKKIGKINSPIPSLPGIYKWWCTKEQLHVFLQQINDQDQYTKNDTSSNLEELFKHIEYCYDSFLNLDLYCIYVGKADSSNGLRNRIFGNHIDGNQEGSTFRKTIYSLKYGKKYDKKSVEYKELNKTYIQDIIDSLYVEWKAYSPEEVDINEIREINSYLRIFNLDLGDLRDNEFSENGHDPKYRRLVLQNITNARTKWQD